MIPEMIRNLKAAVPAAFYESDPSIPWIDVRSDNRPIKITCLTPLAEEFYGSRRLDGIEVASIEDISGDGLPHFRDGLPYILVPPNADISIEDNETEEEVQTLGLEALAWYVSFHYENDKALPWGIFIRRRGLSFLADKHLRGRKRNDINERQNAAFRMLYYHEYFHFLTDMAVANLEMLDKAPKHKKYGDELRRQGVMANTGEPMANAFSLNKVSQRWERRITRFFKSQPAPYNEYGRFLDHEEAALGRRHLCSWIRNGSYQKVEDWAMPEEPYWEFSFNLDPESQYLHYVPLYLVEEIAHPSCAIKLAVRSSSTKVVVHPGDHQPYHVHVSIPPDVFRGRYQYPSLDPFKDERPLSKRDKYRVQEAIDRRREEFEREVYKQHE